MSEDDHQEELDKLNAGFQEYETDYTDQEKALGFDVIAPCSFLKSHPNDRLKSPAVARAQGHQLHQVFRGGHLSFGLCWRAQGSRHSCHQGSSREDRGEAMARLQKRTEGYEVPSSPSRSPAGPNLFPISAPVW